jgi:hypothetical protein
MREAEGHVREHRFEPFGEGAYHLALRGSAGVGDDLSLLGEFAAPGR